MDFDAYILNFARLLRKAGVNISASEVQDCINGLRNTNLAKPIFHQVLRSTLIKDQIHFDVFDHAFNLYFTSEFLDNMSSQNSQKKLTGYEGVAFPNKGAANKGDGEKCCSIPDHGPNWGLGQGAGKLGSNSSRFVQIIRLGEKKRYEDFIKDGIQSLGKLSKEHLDNFKETLRKVKVYLEWNMGINQLAREADKNDCEQWWGWQQRIDELDKKLQQDLEREFSLLFGETALEMIFDRENLNKLDFYRLNDKQVKEIKQRIARLGHKLATRLSFRKASSKKGFIDIRKTIKGSISSGGIPIKLTHKDRIPSKPEIWVLCDLSGSVKRLSEFMLQLTYSFQSRFVRVRSFMFVDTLAEATECFSNKDIEDGIANVYNTLKFSKTGFSDYGQVFKEVYTFYGQDLHRKITLIIIGDAKNNYKPEGQEYLMKVSNEVRRVIWLNPYPAELWDSDDCVVSMYAPYCNKVCECRNLEQLERVARTTFFYTNKDSFLL